MDVLESTTAQHILDLQRRARACDPIPSSATRIDRIARLQALMLDHAEDIAEALTADFGSRPRELSLLTDITSCMLDIDHQKRHLARWMRTERKARWLAAAGFGQQLRHDPKGVVGIMGPWNFPLQLTMVPAAAALAAGNRVMIRPSSSTARTTDVLARHAPDYFDLDELAVITGKQCSGADFSGLRFDHLFFTGSRRVGTRIAQRAAENLVPVTLELGGKNPAVVDRSANIGTAARRIADSRMVNSGQVCLCPDYALVPAEHLDEFVDAVLRRWRRTNPTIQANPHYTSVIDHEAYTRIVNLIDDAIARGATAHTATPRHEPARDPATRKIAPTLLIGVTPGSAVESEEVFGPVLVVYGYDTIDDAVTRINTGPDPLTLYWFGRNNDRFQWLQDRTRSGSINGNDFALTVTSSDLPFGGIGASGTGNYHGRYGFGTFSYARPVAFSRLPISMASVMAAPFHRWDRLAIALQLQAWRWVSRRGRNGDTSRR